MKRRFEHCRLTPTVVIAAMMVVSVSAVAFQATSLPTTELIRPEELVKILQPSKGEKPLLIQVGSHVLYAQAHIPGSEYIGPASSESGLEQLRKACGSSAAKEVHRHLLWVLSVEPLSQCEACCRCLAGDGLHQREGALYC